MSIFDMKFFRFLGFKKKPKAPWKKYYSKEDMDLEIPDISLYQHFKNNLKRYPNAIALSYFGVNITYKEFDDKIIEASKAFLNYGIRKNDVVTICMPNTPEAIIAIFALNKIGAISNMVHPLASVNEIKHTIAETGSVMVVLIDIDYAKIKDAIEDTDVYKIILVKASDSMPTLMKIGYYLMSGRKTELPKKNKKYVSWKDFIVAGSNYHNKNYEHEASKNDPAVMLHSGGSTGTPKAIVLSNGNFITLALQANIRFDELEVGDKCLSIMPIFHGFGLGVCIYAPLCLGANCVLVPQFKPNEFDKLLNKYQPEFVIGVPTLFEALLKIPEDRKKKLNLHYLKYVISGGDSLKSSLEKDMDAFLHEHGADTRLIQGYGMSESLAAVALELKNVHNKRSIGIPLPGCYMGIFSSDDKELPIGEEGEICISGPNVMLGYYNNEKETNLALHIHDDGNIWLHSGDVGVMDKDGFIRYTSRIKRLIISSGYNVYPNQIETLLESHEAVLLCSVVGIPHPYKIEVPKAYIVLRKEYKKSDKLIEEFKELCKKNLPKYAQPHEFEFRESLPKTMIGKVDFRKLQQENNEQRKKENNDEKQNND